MPLVDEVDVAGPLLVGGVPQEPAEVAVVVLHCPGALAVGPLGEDETADEGFEG